MQKFRDSRVYGVQEHMGSRPLAQGLKGTGAKGSVRRKKKAVHKTTASSDDKKLGSTLKKMGVTNIPAIEEVNLFKQNGQVIHFSGPKGERVRARPRPRDS